MNLNIFQIIKDMFKDLSSSENTTETPKIENENNYKETYKSFDDVYNMFVDKVKNIEERDLQKIRESTPMHLQNCSTCKGCKYHTKQGGIVYCCPKWIPSNY
jgi:type I site-specific restriction-modification system R (restriction) subunit